MKWTQVDLTGPARMEEILAACLVEAGCSGVQIIREEDLAALDLDRFSSPIPIAARDNAVEDTENSTASAAQVTVRGYLPQGTDPGDEIRHSLSRSLAPGAARPLVNLTLTTVDDADWSRSWKRYHRPTRFGKRLVVKPSWARYQARPDDLVLTIDPGMAFGTGQHATTRLSLVAIESFVIPGCRLIDVGCGSGILSIAARKLGAGEILALDTDCIAIATLQENLKINGIALDSGQSPRFNIRQSTLEPPYPAAEIVVANILAEVVIHLAPAALACLSAGSGCPGVFIASGIAESQEEAVHCGLEGSGLSIIQRFHLDGWVCLAARPTRLLQ